jgi:hypothetical protein
MSADLFGPVLFVIGLIAILCLYLVLSSLNSPRR